MSTTTTFLDENLYAYLKQVSVREPEILSRLATLTAKRDDSMMQIAAEQGQFMRLLAELMGVKKALEVGVFTGYSTLCVALALPQDGKLIACDINEETTAIARKFWEEAGVSDKIELRIGPAVDTLKQLLETPGEKASFDFAFIDADKAGYETYYELALQLLRRGGLIMLDNVLWSGAICDPNDQENSTLAIRAINEKIFADDRVSISMLPLGDGITLARKN